MDLHLFSCGCDIECQNIMIEPSCSNILKKNVYSFICVSHASSERLEAGASVSGSNVMSNKHSDKLSK